MVGVVSVCPSCQGPLEAENERLSCTSCDFKGFAPSQDLTGGLRVHDPDPVLTPPSAPAVVTRTRFMQGGTTIPVATLASYKHTFVPEQRKEPKRDGPLILAGLGVIFLALGFIAGAALLALGGLCLLVALVWVLSQRTQVTPATHTLVVVSASGTSCTIEGDEPAIDAVHDALDRAIALASS